jgi:succinylglutamate desuccinylase
MLPTQSYEGLQFKHLTYRGVLPGPKLIVLGAVHGNEICGTQGIAKVMAKLDSGELNLLRGVVTFVPITNPLAYRLQQRNGDRNLNRNLAPTSTPLEFEDHIANWLCPLLGAHDVLLDLHSFQSGDRPFAMLGPIDNQGGLERFAHQTLEQNIALAVGVTRYVDGWLSTYDKGVKRRVAELATVRAGSDARANLLNTDSKYGVGTTEYMRSQGGCAVTLECGHHAAASAPVVAENAIMNILAELELIAAPKPLKPVAPEVLSLYEVIDKVDEADAFNRAWLSFDKLNKGNLIGTRANGEKLIAQQDGFIVFPNSKSHAGQEWFYLAHANKERFSSSL